MRRISDAVNIRRAFSNFLIPKMNRKKTLPQLPADVWFRISTYLDPASLSSLSQVNITLNDIATDRSHFRRHHPVPQNSSIHPAQCYRRFRALSFVPNLESSICLPKRVNILCSVQDTLLLHDGNSSRIIAVPSGKTIDIAKVLDPLEGGLSWLYLRARIITLPGSYIAFKSAINPARLVVLNVDNWEVRTMNMGEGMKPLIVGIVHGKPTMLGGNNGEWVIYFVDEGSSRKIVFYDWRTGAVVNEITNASRNLKFVMGECPAVNSMTVVGVVSETSDGFTREVKIMSFDGDWINFRFSPEQDVEAVLRSKDASTHVLIVSKMCAHNIKRMSFLWSRVDKDGAVSGGRSLPTTTVPELRENGNVIVAKYSSNFSHVDASLTRPREVWIFLNEVRETSEFLERCTIKVNKYGTPPTWIRRTVEGGLALIVHKRVGSVALVKFESNRETAEGSCLNEWSVPGGVNNICVVSDHFVVISSLDRRLHLLHFDQFCHGSGVYACPKVIPKGIPLASCEQEGW